MKTQAALNRKVELRSSGGCAEQTNEPEPFGLCELRSQRKLIQFAVLLFSFSCLTALATDYTFQLVAVPGYTHSRGYGINNSGAIVLGAGSNEASFLRDSSGAFTEFHYSGHTPTVALGINNFGVVIGDAYNRPTSSYSGFIRGTSGTFSDFTYPGAVGPNGGMQVNDINDSGVIVGGYAVSSSDRGSFIRGPGGKFQTFRFMDDPNTLAYGINNAGDISGQSGVGSFLRYADGTFLSIAVPGASETKAFGVNNSGQVVGLYVSDGVHGFVRHRNGSFSFIEVPGAENSQPWSINDSGQIVGIALVDDRNYAFIATPVPKPNKAAAEDLLFPLPPQEVAAGKFEQWAREAAKQSSSVTYTRVAYDRKAYWVVEARFGYGDPSEKIAVYAPTTDGSFRRCLLAGPIKAVSLAIAVDEKTGVLTLREEANSSRRGEVVMSCNLKAVGVLP